MTRGSLSGVLLAILWMVATTGCGSSGISPATPDITSTTNQDAAASAIQPSTQMVGFYEVSIDPDTGIIDISENRSALFNVNVVHFMNSKPMTFSVKLNSLSYGPGYLDANLDITLTHPFQNLPQYNGYDIRGIMISNGSASMGHNADLIYPVMGTDQVTLNADGYSRWFNMAEFPVPGTLGYTPGFFATKFYIGDATLNGCKYYADGLGPTEDLWQFLTSSPGTGVFSSGATNSRNHIIRFPNSTGIKFAYSIVASWGGEAPEFHPTNTIEAIASSVMVTDDIWYVDPMLNDGDLILDIDIFDRSSTWTSGPMTDYTLVIESTVLSVPYTLNSTEMTPVPGGDHVFSYHVEIPADNITSNTGNEFWINVVYPGYDYTNPFGVPNAASTDPLTASFRYPLAVSSVNPTFPPTCDLQIIAPPMPAAGWEGHDLTVTFDSGADDPDIPNGDFLTYSWDFDSDGVFGDPADGGTDAAPEKIYSGTGQTLITVKVRVTDKYGQSVECQVDVDITWNISLTIDVSEPYYHPGRDIALCPVTGDFLITYQDGDVRRYHANTTYTTFDTIDPDFQYNSQLFIDVDDSGNWAVCSGAGSNYYKYLDHFDADDVLIQHNQFSVPNSGGIKDVFCMPDFADTRAGDHLVFFGWYVQYGNWNYSATWGYEDPDFTTQYWSTGYWSFFDPWGPDKLYGLYVRGVEQVREEAVDHIWIIENGDYYAERFDIGGSALTYVGPTWGTGAQTDSDDGFYYCYDVTSAKPNRYYVIDTLSDDTYAIKGFIDNDTSVTSLPQFTYNWMHNPFRLDGDPAAEVLAVLEVDWATGNSAVTLIEGADLP